MNKPTAPKASQPATDTSVDISVWNMKLGIRSSRARGVAGILLLVLFGVVVVMMMMPVRSPPGTPLTSSTTAARPEAAFAATTQTPAKSSESVAESADSSVVVEQISSGPYSTNSVIHRANSTLKLTKVHQETKGSHSSNDLDAR